MTKTPRTKKKCGSQVQLKEAVNIESVAVAINAKTFQKVKSTLLILKHHGEMQIIFIKS